MTCVRVVPAIIVLAALAAPAPGLAGPGGLERGAYLASIMGCGDCHTPRGADGAPVHEKGLSGGSVGFEMPGVGVVWPPNLTPDATGLGTWTTPQIVAAIREGVRPDGRVLAPIMPWQAYAVLSDEDAGALVAWLRAQAPVENQTPAPVPEARLAAAPYSTVVFPD